MQQTELIIKPDIVTVHARVYEIVEVFSAGNPRIEGDIAIRIGMQHHAATTAYVGTAQTRAVQGALDVVVEVGGLVPEAVIPRHVLRSLGAVIAVVEEAGLGRDNRTRRGLACNTVQGTLKKIGVGNDLVIVDEDDRVVTENRGGNETEIADGTIARKASGALVLAHAHLLETTMDEAHLGIADDDDIEIHEVVGNGTNALDRLVLDTRLCCDEQNDAIDTSNMTQRLEATGKLAWLIDGGHVVIHDTAINRMR